MENEYEKQLQEENDKLREKLAEALNILDDSKRELEEKVKKYGKNKEMKNWENIGNTWEVCRKLNQYYRQRKYKNETST